MPIALLTVAATSLVAPPQDPHPSRIQCRIERPQLVANPDGKPPAPRFRRLGELPPADTLLTVRRMVDGCPKPAIIRYGR